MASNTVGFVCNRALELAQLDSSFLSLSRQHYNMNLKNVSSNYDWPFYRVQNPDTVFISGQRSYALPVDYNRSDTCYLVNSSGQTSPIIIVSKYRFDRALIPTTAGNPNVAYIDLTNQKIVFNSSPSGTFYSRLTYFRDAVEVDEGGSDDATTIDYENPLFMVYKTAGTLLDYQDDQRAEAFHARADKILHDQKINSFDEDNDSVVELGSRFRPGSRPSRSGGWWGSWSD